MYPQYTPADLGEETQEYVEDEPQVYEGGAVKVHIASSDVKAERIMAADFASTMTFTLPQFGDNVPPLQILSRRYRRYKGLVTLMAAGATTQQAGSDANGAIGAGTGGNARLLAGAFLTGFTVTFAAATSAATTVQITNVVGGPLTYDLPSGTTFFSQQFTTPMVPAVGVATRITVTVPAVVGVGPGNINVTGLIPAGTTNPTNPNGAVSVVFNSSQDALASNNPQGVSYSLAGLALPFKLPDWESQRPLYGVSVGQPGNNAVVTVIDYGFAEPEVA